MSLSLSLRKRASRSSLASLAQALGPSSVGLSAVGAPLMAGEVEEMAQPVSPHEAFSENNPKWARIQQAMIALFQGKKPSAQEMTDLSNSIKEMAVSDSGPFIYDHYKKSLLTRGMQILLFKLDTTTKDKLIESLEKTWLMFYTEIMPIISILMKPVMTPTVLMNCRRTAVVAFRDKVVLKCDVEKVLAQKNYEPPETIKQMLLVLQYARDGDPPSENYLALEKLVALAVTPLLGYLGLYESKGNLTVTASNPKLLRRVSNEESRRRTTFGSTLPLPRSTSVSAPVPIPYSNPTAYPPSSSSSSFTPSSAVHRRQVSVSSVTESVLETVAEDERPASPPRGALAARVGERRRHTLGETVIRGQLLRSSLLAQQMGS